MVATSIRSDESLWAISTDRKVNTKATCLPFPHWDSLAKQSWLHPTRLRNTPWDQIVITTIHGLPVCEPSFLLSMSGARSWVLRKLPGKRIWWWNSKVNDWFVLETPAILRSLRINNPVPQRSHWSGKKKVKAPTSQDTDTTNACILPGFFKFPLTLQASGFHKWCQ